jgi:Prokaryotic N-terminal methylation motif
MRTQRTRRAAFTLVEMMVAMALTLFIMAIIAQAFGAAQQIFSTMRTAGQLQERMRSGAMVLRRDLQSEHFDGPFLAGRGGPRVGDQRLDQIGWYPPPRGYFEIRQFTLVNIPPTPAYYVLPSLLEPVANPVTDGEGIVSTRAGGLIPGNPTPGHVLRFTVRLPDLPAAELFSAELPTVVNTTLGPAPLANNNQVNAFVTGQAFAYSRWAEVQYFLRENGQTTPDTPNGQGVPLYSLRRRVRLLAPVGVTINVNGTPAPMSVADATALLGRYPDVALAAVPGPGGTAIVRVLGPDDVANPANRMQYFAYSQRTDLAGNNPYETGDDILITDLISFEVKAAWFENQSPPPNGLPAPPQPYLFEFLRPGSSPPSRTMGQGNTEAPFDDLPQLSTDPLAPPLNPSFAGQRLFDTWYRGDDGIDWDKALPTAGGQAGFLTPSFTNVPLRINVRAVQIKMRVWDSEKKQARQMTIVQEI